MAKQLHEYQPELDGLRAIAVSAVVLFHLDFDWIKNGFLGVDVFFVLSGFLITRMIIGQMDEGRFRFSTFYLRRFRRLFPAYIITIAISLLVGALLFPVTRFNELGASALNSAFHLANLHWAWQDMSYFWNQSIRFQPLLHLWSLSVEEQFYLVWPLLLLLSTTILGRYWALLILTITSGFVGWLCVNPELLGTSTGNFYYPHIRAFEFGIGALTFVLIRARPSVNPILQDLLLAASLIMLILLLIESGPLYLLGKPLLSEEILLACLLTAICIYSSKSPKTGALLRLKPIVGLGVISYSLYLVHWPLNVFYGFIEYEGSLNSVGERIGLMITAIILAILLYRYVEQPFRASSGTFSRASSGAFWKKTFMEKPPAFSNRGFMLGSLALTVIVATTAWFAKYETYESSRIGAENQTTKNFKALNLQHKDTVCGGDQYVNKPGMGCNLNFNSGLQTDILVFGDSQLISLSNLFADFARRHQLNMKMRWSLGCPPLFQVHFRLFGSPNFRCAKRQESIRKLISRTPPKFIVITGSWNSFLGKREDFGMMPPKHKSFRLITNPKLKSSEAFSHAIVETAEILSLNNTQVAILSPIPMIGAVPEDCYLLPKALAALIDQDARCWPVTVERVLQKQDLIENIIERASESLPRVNHIHLSKYFCDRPTMSCRLRDSQGRLLYEDPNHLSLDGMQFISDELQRELAIAFKLETRLNADKLNR